MEDGGENEGKKYSQLVYNQLEPKQETLDEILTRHRKEINKLQKQEIELKKAAAKGSKTDQKAKKKKVDELITRLSTQLREKHTDELTLLGYNDDCKGQEKHVDSLVRAVAGVSVSNECKKSSTSKSMKRRDKKAREEVERERRIESEKNNILSERFVEMEKLERKLGPVGLTINEVKADGHCLYRAVEDQLAFISGGSSSFTHQELRVMVASYMRKHTSDFLPFFLSENVGERELEQSVSERFEQYCRDIEFTAAWGGHLELEALAHCLMKHIVVFSGSFPDVELGNEYKVDKSSTCANPSIMLSFHRHAFGLGEHYNSVIVDSTV